MMGPQLTPLQEPWLIFLAVRTQPQTGAYWELILSGVSLASTYGAGLPVHWEWVSVLLHIPHTPFLATTLVQKANTWVLISPLKGAQEGRT